MKQARIHCPYCGSLAMLRPGKRDSWSVRHFRRNVPVRLPPLACL